MITPQEFVTSWKSNPIVDVDPEDASLWGQTNLVVYDPAIVEQLLIDTNSKHFLVEAGLPCRVLWMLQFEIPELQFRLLQDAFPEFQVYPALQRYRIIGVEAENTLRGPVYFRVICIDEDEQGHVVMISNNNGLDVRFLNSSICQLAEFLLAFRDDYAWMSVNCKWSEPRQSFADYSQRLLNKLAEIDLQATLGQGGWKQTIDEIRDLAG